jgi:acyl-CoA reductase-like NAD-dependent aldehyde dehydrogenase
MDKTITISNFINNVFVQSESKIESFNPSNGRLLCLVPDSGKLETDMAVEAALQGYYTFST